MPLFRSAVVFDTARVNEQRPFMSNTTSTLAIAALFLVAGIGHFVIPAWFDRIVPTWIPNPRLATYVSGVAEIAGALGVLYAPTRRAAGIGLIALLVAVYPANINMLQMARASAASSTMYLTILWLRLPLQPLMVWWVYGAAVRR